MTNKILITTSLLITVFISACKKTEQIPPVSEPIESPIFNHSLITSQLTHDSLGFRPDSITYELHPALDETSGIVGSINNPNMFWLHEDSGSGAAIYLYDKTGKRKQRYQLTGIASRDYEDIAIARNEKGIPIIYLADIGDNSNSRKNIQIFAIPEPNFLADTVSNTISQGVQTINLNYPDNIAYNAEAILVSPNSSDLWIFTKANGKCKVFNANLAHNQPKLTHVGNLDIRFQTITAADMSSDGKEILIKSYEYIYYWKGNNNQEVADILTSEPVVIPYLAEVQGEAICWANKNAYLTISEAGNGISPKFQFYSR